VRFLFVIVSALILAQCASSEDRRFRVGDSASAFVIIGVAETSDSRAPRYAMLWRLLDSAGAFTSYDDSRIIEARTNAGSSVRIRGVPGEFLLLQVQPGAYALDSVFAVLREGQLDYIAQGVIAGPERPAFAVRPGEAVYLGIWELDIDGAEAVSQLWRLDSGDLRAVVRASEEVVGDVRLRETHIRDVPCAPHRVSNMSQRLVC
jgi:hypothetical protein